MALKEEIISPSEYSTIMQDYQSYSIFQHEIRPDSPYTLKALQNINKPDYDINVKNKLKKVKSFGQMEYDRYDIFNVT